jgi:hypothetical protein
VSDIDTVVVGGLKALDSKRPIREAAIGSGRLMCQKRSYRWQLKSRRGTPLSEWTVIWLLSASNR